MAVYDTFEFIQSVPRKIPAYAKAIQLMLYLSVVIFTVIGTMGGPLWLIPALGTLFVSWFYSGSISITYIYHLQGSILAVQRISGLKSKQNIENFGEFDLTGLRMIAPEGSQVLDVAEAEFQRGASGRVSYDVSAHNPRQICSVMYLRGTKEEAGKSIKMRFQPGSELLAYIQQIAPDRMAGYGGT